MVKVTFTFDDATVVALKQVASRVGKPQSMVVREAIHEYGARVGRLTEDERRRQLRALDAFAKQPQTRTATATAREIAGVRAARRRRGRASA